MNKKTKAQNWGELVVLAQSLACDSPSFDVIDESEFRVHREREERHLWGRRGSPATLERTVGVAEGTHDATPCHTLSHLVQFQKGQKGKAVRNIFGFLKVY